MALEITHFLKDKKIMENQIIPDEIIMNQIYYIRGQKVMLDFDLAKFGRFGDMLHPIPWQTDHPFCWQRNASDALAA